MKCKECHQELGVTPFYIDWMKEDGLCTCYFCSKCEQCFMTTEQRDKFKRLRKPAAEMGHYPGLYCKEVRNLEMEVGNHEEKSN